MRFSHKRTAPQRAFIVHFLSHARQRTFAVRQGRRTTTKKGFTVRPSQTVPVGFARTLPCACLNARQTKLKKRKKSNTGRCRLCEDFVVRLSRRTTNKIKKRKKKVTQVGACRRPKLKKHRPGPTADGPPPCRERRSNSTTGPLGTLLQQGLRRAGESAGLPPCPSLPPPRGGRLGLHRRQILRLSCAVRGGGGGGAVVGVRRR